ncbi:MAG TPA: DNRLRE domain-containing protein, partial [Flavisolibacter sp.]|nr:DNRLRE domain-containing protein [Flavisolibacter sp.]
KHAGGPVSRPIKLTVYFYDQEDYYASGILSSYEVSMDAGQSEVYVGHIKRNYNVDAQEGHYYYYTYQECYIDENSIICNQPTSCTTTLTNSATKEVLLTSNFPTSSIACNGSDEFDAFRWTNNNIWLSGRSLLQFDLSGIPANATITSAKISLYAHPFSQNGNKTVAMYGNNSSYLQRVTSDWQCGLTWNIMPGTTITNEVLLSQSSSSNQDYTGIDITAMVKDMMSAGNYGIMLKQAIESDQNYHSMIFYGPSASDPSKRPKLDICYTVPPVPLPSSECKDDSRYPLYANKIRIFNDYINMEGYLNYLSQNQNAVSNDQALASAKTYALSNLSDLKDEWKNTLQEVRDEEFDKSTIGDDKISQIVDNLYLIAKYHIDQAISIDKVYPTRALPGNLTINNYHDFKSVFLGVLGKPIVDKGFGADLISQPYPEGKEPVVANLSSGDLTPQICSNISALRARFGTGSDLNFHNWLKTELQDDYILTFSQFQDILSRCANNCRLLDQPVALPVAFTAPSGQAWKVCDTVSFYKNRFAAEYPSVVPDTKLYRVLLANYLNFNLGYALSYDEYSDFIKSCANNSGLVLYNKPASPLLQNNDDACTISVLAGIFDRAGQEYVQYIETKRKEFRNQLVSKCLSNTTSLNLEGDQYEYHYTLYYYDQSGNLVKTIPPEGVKLLTNEEMDLLEQHLNDDVVQCDGSGVPTTENHIATFNALSTALQYNNIHGMDMWWYDRNNGDRQVRFITPDQKYFYQAAIANKKLWVEMYALVPGTGEISIVNSNKAVADISSIPVQNWSHLFVQTPLAMLKNPVPANTALTLGSSYTNTTTLASITNNFTVELWVNPTTPHEIDVQGTTGYPGISGEKYVFIPPWGGPSAVSQAGMGISVGTNGVSVYEHADNYMPATLVWSGTIS